MAITKRDENLIKNIGRYGIFSTNYIVEKYFNSVDYSTVMRRLRLLEKRNLIRRAGFLSNKENVWAITQKGNEVAKLPAIKSYWHQSNLEHDHKLVKLRLFLEEGGIAKNWIAEHEIRSMVYQKYSLRDAKNKLIPDGIFQTKIQNTNQSMAFELELNLKNEKRYRKLIDQYEWKKDLFGVFYVVPNEQILNKLKYYWERFNSYSREIRVYFMLLDDLLSLKGEAKLYALKETFLMKNFFTMAAHLPAQVVVIKNERPRQNGSQLTSLDHTPFIRHPN